MQISPSLIDWSNPVSDWANDLGLVDGWMAVPGKQGYGTGTWRSLRGRYNGTLTNMDPATDWVTESPRGAWGSLDFDGTNDYVSVPSSLRLPATGDFTLSARFRTSNAAEQNIFSNNNAQAGRFDFKATSVNGGTYRLLVFFNSGTNLVLYGVTQTNDGEWHNGVVTREGNQWTLYLDAGQEATTTNSGTISQSDFRIASGFNSGFEQRLNGNLESLFYFDQALTAAQVASLYKDSLQGYPRFLRRLPTRRTFFIPSGGTVTLTTATESDTANSITVVNPRTYTLATATETDAANAITVQQAATVSLGTASEADAANALTVVNPRTYQLGTATETSTANAVTLDNPRSYTLGNASETDTANAVTINNDQSVSLGTASETALANSLTVVNPRSYTLATAAEVNVGRAVTIINPRAYNLATATETDLANALSVISGDTTAGFIKIRNAVLKTGRATATLKTGRATATLTS